MIPSPLEVLKLAFDYIKLNSSDNLVDLGSGDGRVCLYASKYYGCYSEGYEIDKELYNKANDTNEWMKTNVKFFNKDIKSINLSKYSVIYCFPEYYNPIYNDSFKLIEFTKVSNAKIISLDYNIELLQLNKILEFNRYKIYVYEVS